MIAYPDWLRLLYVTKNKRGSLKEADFVRCSPKEKPAFAKATAGEGGGDRNRTGVQTYSSKAFYMLIPVLGCREITGTGQPIISLAAFPIARVFCCQHSLWQQHPVFLLIERRSWQQDCPLTRP